METIINPGPSDIDPLSQEKADLGKRLAAALIDGLLVYAFALVLSFGGMNFLYGIGLLVGAGYFLVRDGLALEFMDGRSIGKKLMKLRPVHFERGTLDLETSIRRNWPLAIGFALWGIAGLARGLGMYLFAGGLGIIAWIGSLLYLVEGILVLTDPEGRRFGDKFAETLVVDEDPQSSLASRFGISEQQPGVAPIHTQTSAIPQSSPAMSDTPNPNTESVSSPSPEISQAPPVMSDAAIMMQYDANKKTSGTAYILCYFLGFFGAHRFYLGETGTGAALLAITLCSFALMIVFIGFITIFISATWVFVDLFLIPGLVKKHNSALAHQLGATGVAL